MTAPPRVVILTVTTNAAAHLPAYLDAIGRLQYPNLELCVVDNTSYDGSPALVRERFPAATVLENTENLGFTGASNRGLREILASGVEYVLFLNDDTEIAPDCIDELVALADERTLVAPITYLADRPGLLDDAFGDFDWLRGTWKTRRLGRPPRASDRYPHAIDNANLSCLLVPAAAFETVGLLDEAFFVYYDDTDFCRRVQDAGFRIFFQPRAVVHHRKGATIGGQQSAFGCYYLTRNRAYLMRKHLGRGPRFTAFLVYFGATRTARTLAWMAQRRWDLVNATVTGVRDFIFGDMGRRG